MLDSVMVSCSGSFSVYTVIGSRLPNPAARTAMFPYSTAIIPTSAPYINVGTAATSRFINFFRMNCLVNTQCGKRTYGKFSPEWPKHANILLKIQIFWYVTPYSLVNIYPSEWH